MTNKPSKSATIAKTIKKSAKALLSGKKDIKRLAAALPLTAILVEEVRAAQKPSLDVLSTLAQDDALSLDQDLALDQTTDALDVQQGEVTDALLNDQLAVLPEDASLPAVRSDRDLLLAQADTPSPASGGTITDAGAAGGGTGVGAGAAAPFELSALPLAGAGIAPLAGALGLGAVAASNNTADGTAAKTYTFAIVKASDDQGALQDDLQNNAPTDDETPTLVGTSDPGSVIQISEAGFTFGSVVADASGNWSFTLPIKQAQGAHTYTATMVVDDVVVKTTTFNLTIDIFQPNAPAAPFVAESGNGGINIAEAANGTEVEVSLTGANALVGDKVTVTIDGIDTFYTLLATDITAGKAMVAIAKSVLDAAGQGSASVTAFITDAAGNSSAVSAATTINIDTLAPNAPAASLVAESGNGGINIAEAANGTEVEVGLSGSNAVAGDKVTVTIDGIDTVYTLLATDITAGKAMVAIAKSVLDAAGQGSASVTAFITDAAGNSSALSAATTINIDTLAPSAPLLQTIEDDFGLTTGAVSAKVITDDTTPTFRGTGIAGDTITVFDGTTQLGTTQVLPNGTWSFTPTAPLSAGAHSVTSQATDTAGNTGIASAAVEFVIGGLTLTEAQAADVLAKGESYANSDNVTLNQGYDNLSLSLKQLKKLGIDAVSVAGVVGDLNLDLGSGPALTSGVLPVFGDSNNNGTLSAAEDAALSVSLNVDSLAQINELSSISSGLAASGIDNVSLRVADQTALDGVFADSAFGTNFDSMVAAGLNTSIDMTTNLASLNAAQASSMIAEGLHFASNDFVGLQIHAADATGTHLSTSLKDLQKLGVDAVGIGSAPGDAAIHGINLDLGTGPSTLSASGLPIFGDSNNNGTLSAAEDAALNVSLNVDSLAQINELSSLSSGLAASGIDNVNLRVADQTALEAVFANSGFGTSFDSLTAAGLSASIDMTTNLASLNAAQASSMIAEGLHFASNDIVDVQFDTAQGTHLSTSLKDLQKLGVDAVGIGSAPGDAAIHGISLDLGTGTSPLSASGLPKFGDANLDGTLSAAEDAALNVTLNVANLSQLHEVAGVSGLAALGIDDVSLNFTNQAAFDTAFGANSSLVADLLALQNAGLNTGTIDMVSNAATLSATQAHAMVVDGLHFASADSITVNADGTHLSTSLKELQKLGVDAVSVAAGGDTQVGLDLGNFSSFDVSSFSGLPVFDDNLDVTLGVNSLDQLHGVTNAAVVAALNSANIDSIQLNVADQAAFDSVWSSPANTSAFANDLVALNNAGLGVTTLDVGGSFINAQIHLTELQAATLNNAGLHFANNDFVTMDVTAAQGTHLNTSMADLKKLGVDSLTITDGENITDLGVLANSLTSHGITHLGLSSSDLANVTVTAGSTLVQKVGTFDWADSGIDFSLNVDSNVVDFMQDLENGIDVFNGQALSNTAKWGDLIQLLQDAGLGGISLQSAATTSATSANVVVSDELTGALYDAGMLHALPDANITLDVGANKVLQTSLKAMLDIGVDSVQTTHKVYVGLGLDEATAKDMQGLFASFTYDTTVPNGGLFGGKEAALVVDQATFNTMGASDVHTLVQQLSKLGITEIDVLSNANVVTHAYQITAQTQVLSQVDILGTSSAGTDLAVFDTDILNKTIKV